MEDDEIPTVSYPGRGRARKEDEVEEGLMPDEYREEPGLSTETSIVVKDAEVLHNVAGGWLFGAMFASMLDSIDDMGGRWSSAVVRSDPNSGATHFLLDGKRYMLVVQAIDMPDRSSGR
jgi:hypothetical protein